jgi:hypothetical protein
MGKLVLAILAIAVLQGAFLVYTMMDETAQLVADTGNRVPRANPGPVSVPMLPRTAATEDVSGKASVGSKDNETGAPSFDRQSRKPRSRSIPESPRRPATVTAVRPADRFRQTDIQLVQANSDVPRRYEVIVVDYPTYSREKVDPKMNSVKRKKKRPFIAKALNVVVKKPWNWMKSMASKLD